MKLASSCACLAERQGFELLATSEIGTPFLKSEDRAHIEMWGLDGRSIFGAIDQEVVLAPRM